MEREIGNLIKIDFKKNRIIGREAAIELPIYHSHGIDDVGSCVSWLVQEKHWTAPGKGKKNNEVEEETDKKGKKKKGGVIEIPEWGWCDREETIIKRIEMENKERDLRLIVRDVWKAIEDEMKVERKPRYS